MSSYSVTAILCKEKWKNIRTVFVRRLKPEVNSLTKRLKKPYYLNEMLHFLLPYVKPYSIEMSGQENMSSSDQITIKNENDFEIDTDNLNEEPTLDSIQETEWASVEEDIASSEILSNQVNEEIEAAPEKSRNNVNKGKKRKKEISDIDKLSTQSSGYGPYKLDEDNSRRMFLLSLLPELNEMNDRQMKLFKRRVLALIDDVLAE